MLLILDYDMGYIASISSMFHPIGYDDVIISEDKADIDKATNIILPGVVDRSSNGLKEAGIGNIPMNAAPRIR